MTEFTFKIDTKSLYFGIKNDNDFGHTATVATNLRQGTITKPGLSLIRNLPNRLNPEKLPDLVQKCALHSKTAVRITDLFVFDEIYVDGIKIKTNFSFCFYIKEEIDQSKYQCGRLKLHYPISLAYDDGHLSVNNRDVFDSIAKHIGHYAFLVRAFRFLPAERSVDFITSIVGPEEIPYSKVFADQKGGKGNFAKTFAKLPDAYDMEIIALKHSPLYAGGVTPENFKLIATEMQNKAIDIVINELEKDPENSDILAIVREYPFSLYDIEYHHGTEKKYLIVKSTATSLTSFYLSNIEYTFLADYKDSAKLILVQKAGCDHPTLLPFSFEEISSFAREIVMTRFTKG